MGTYALAVSELFQTLGLASGHVLKAAVVKYNESRHALCVCDLQPHLLEPRKQCRIGDSGRFLHCPLLP